MTGWLARAFGHPPRNPEVQAAMEERDELLIKADAAILKVDQVQNEIIEDYAEAERQRVKNGERKR